jgi:hypothetical protein
MDSGGGTAGLAGSDRQTSTIHVAITKATIEGIKHHGPEAAGIVMVGLAHLILVIAGLAAIWLASLCLGFNASAYSVGASGAAGAWAWWLRKRQP